MSFVLEDRLRRISEGVLCEYHILSYYKYRIKHLNNR